MAKNINGSSDPFYRYTMPDLVVVVEAKNGGQTVLVNLGEVAHALHRPPAELHKYLAYALACAGTYRDGKYILQGNRSKTELTHHLHLYIKQCVLCIRCGNPETTCTRATLTCKACGQKGTVRATGKFMTYLCKQ